MTTFTFTTGGADSLSVRHTQDVAALAGFHKSCHQSRDVVAAGFESDCDGNQTVDDGAYGGDFVFTQTLVIQLQHTDAYGRLFYPHQPAFCHGVFQAWLESVGLPLPPTSAQTDHVVVVVRLESDYLAPLQLGDRITADFRVVAVGTTSFTYELTFTRQDGVTCGRCRIVMVTVDPTHGGKMPVPARLRCALTAALHAAASTDQSPAAG